MDILFTTSVIIDGQSNDYRVTFADDAYVFTPDADTGAPTFRIRRDEDLWKLDGNLSDISRQQAVSALESYLLSQHWVKVS